MAGMDGVVIPGLGSSSDPLEAVLGPFPCVRLRNLPFDASSSDVLVFFQGFVVLDVVLKGNGEAFVVFANPMDFQMALQRDGQSMGRRFIEVVTGQRKDYYAAIAEQQWEKQKKEQIQQTDPQAPSVEDVALEASLSTTASPLPWLITPVGTHAPVGAHAPQSVPTPPVGEDPIGRGKGLIVQPGRGGGRPGPRFQRTGGGIQVGEHTGFLRMRGLPFSSTKEDIITFFRGHKIVPDSIVMTYRGDGRATGEGYVGFETPEDSKGAMALHRNTMGSRYIELFISNKEEHSRAFARFGGR